MTNTSPAIRLDIKPRIVEIRLSKENPTKKKKSITQANVTEVNHVINEVSKKNLFVMVFKVNLINNLE
jgi:hypothetical protein